MSAIRTIAIANSNSVDETTLELDSHADTTCVGSKAMIVSRSGKIVDVSGYDPSTTSRKLQVVTAAVAYDRPTSGETIILIIHQAIHVPPPPQHNAVTNERRHHQ